MKNSTIIIIVLVVISIFAVIGISLGVGLYLYFKKSNNNTSNPDQPYGLFGIKLSTPISPPDNRWSMKRLDKAVSGYLKDIKQIYGVDSLATTEQVNTGVTTYGFNDCTLYCTDDTFRHKEIKKSKYVILPYWAASDSPSDTDLKNCYAKKEDNVGKHSVNYVSLTSTEAPIGGFLVYSTNPPEFGSTNTINGQQVTISGKYTL
jgi:hypothetical protein